MINMDVAQELECAPGLLEGCSSHQRVFDGKVLPKILCAASTVPISLADALHNLAQNKKFIEQQLQDHGAVLLRDFPLQGAEDFDAVVQTLGWQEVSYKGTVMREQVAGRVLTSTDIRADLPIPFHHEMTQVKTGPPAKILFFCDIEPIEGGNTPIVLSHKIEEKMREEFPHFVQKLEEEGIFYTRTLLAGNDPSLPYPGRGWPDVFGTNDRVEAEKRAEEYFDGSLVWLPDGKVNIIQGPYKGVRSFHNNPSRKQWFNMISFTKDPKDEDPLKNGSSIANMDAVVSSDGIYTAMFKDGKPLPKQAVARSKDLLEIMSVDIPWKRGDIMIVDNLAVMHGRRPCYHPRRILVALCDY